ncbi:hypothetical protein FRC17_009893 [Serendipita sp. 399]|nr:hypothetical protein FRC17_009893 [Serendipita sp. 399]
MPGSPNNKRLKLSLAKTKNYMNLSGPSVKKTYDEKLHNTQTFHPRNRRVIIIHDSIDQAPMKISPRFGGSARGHNGVRSVIAALGTQDFYRIRIGIGCPPRGVLEQYVLERLSKEELEYWSPGGEGIERVWEAIVKIIEDEYVPSRIRVGNEERKQNPRKDLPEFAVIPAPFKNKTYKQLWFKRLKQKRLLEQQRVAQEAASGDRFGTNTDRYRRR